ncbi:MAG: AAA family ATPase [Muribaculaceae bacterium]|nr:AAA family ATPase [Muribaculaceae bacterium]
MPRIFHLHIENFRGIEKFDHCFNPGLTCIIGRGNSGKTTILDAISYVLTPMHTIPFHDGDFYNCNIENPIIIEVTLVGLSEEILRKFGDRIRGVRGEEIISSMTNPTAQEEGVEDAVTIRLKVEKDLEPVWEVIGDEGVEPRIVRASERELFNCFYISEYTDRHFTLSKGSPLSSLFRQKADKKSEVLNAELIAQLSRDTKQGFESAIGMPEVFNDVIKDISKNASELGISTGTVKASIDQREFLLKDNKIALHQDDIPLRQLGKGSKRLLSLAIQLSLTDPSGIILIDEIEQGLEPDRVQHIVSLLKKKTGLQVILTTHSSNAIVELSCSDLYIRRNQTNGLINIPSTDEMQGTLRKNPEAFFAKRVIMCEGATEVGIIRGLNEYLLRPKGMNLAKLGVRYADGTGKNLTNYVTEFNRLGYPICLFCDSDAPDVNDKKAGFRAIGVVIVDCEGKLALEQQLFKDLPWISIKKLIEYYLNESHNNTKTLYNNLRSYIVKDIQYSEDWWKIELPILRNVFGNVAKSAGWYKNITHGDYVASVIVENLEATNPSFLYNMVNNLTEWMLKQE